MYSSDSLDCNPQCVSQVELNCIHFSQYCFEYLFAYRGGLNLIVLTCYKQTTFPE